VPDDALSNIPTAPCVDFGLHDTCAKNFAACEDRSHKNFALQQKLCHKTCNLCGGKADVSKVVPAKKVGVEMSTAVKNLETVTKRALRKQDECPQPGGIYIRTSHGHFGVGAMMRSMYNAFAFQTTGYHTLEKTHGRDNHGRGEGGWGLGDGPFTPKLVQLLRSGQCPFVAVMYQFQKLYLEDYNNTNGRKLSVGRYFFRTSAIYFFACPNPGSIRLLLPHIYFSVFDPFVSYATTHWDKVHLGSKVARALTDGPGNHGEFVAELTHALSICKSLLLLYSAVNRYFYSGLCARLKAGMCAHIAVRGPRCDGRCS
jgi:hypothetical protein